MSNYKPYFKYLWELNKKMLVIFAIIFVINTITTVWGILESASYHDTLMFSSQSSAMGIVICVVLGLFYSLMLFAHSMSIKADRVGFIKAALCWGVVMSLGLGVLGFMLDMGCKAFIETYTGKSVDIFSQINWINDGEYGFVNTLISRIFNNLTLFSTGFMIGAIWYRLKVKYSILIFVILPIVLVTYAANYGFRNPEKIEKFGLKILNTMEFFMVNQHISNSFKAIGIIIFTLAGVNLLIKAPIKEYANDLI